MILKWPGYIVPGHFGIMITLPIVFSMKRLSNREFLCIHMYYINDTGEYESYHKQNTIGLPIGHVMRFFIVISMRDSVMRTMKCSMNDFMASLMVRVIV